MSSKKMRSVEKATSRQTLPMGLERRKEDYPLITGHGTYVDDIRLPTNRPSVLHMAVVRSPYAHARITGFNLEAARAVEGVVGVYSGDELVQGLPFLPTLSMPNMPEMKYPQRYPLAVGKARYAGDPVAIVLAENSYVARDARDLVDVDYEPLPVVIDPEKAAQADAPLLYEELETNVIYQTTIQGGDIERAFAQAERRLHLRLLNQRISPASMEPRACLFDFDGSELTAWISGQALFLARTTLAHFLQLAPEQVRVRNADVGGAFGAKATFLGEEIIAALLAKKLARPVKWIEDRSENLQAQIHGRGQINEVEAAYTSEGLLLALKVRTLGDIGASLYSVGPLLPIFTAGMLSGPYRVQALDCQVSAVLTNKVPTGPYRGAGRPEAAYIMERTIEGIARALELDPVEVRRRNLIAPDAFPYKTPSGLIYDSGNYQAALEKALVLADYEGWRARQRERRIANEGKLLGIGVSTFIETTGGGTRPGTPADSATVRILRDGSLLVQSPVAHNGQGHFTVFAQIAAEVFGLPGSRVEVQINDSALPGYSAGTNASRVTQISGSAIHLAAVAVRKKAFQVASQMLEASVEDLEMSEGRISVRGLSSRGVELGEVARLVEEQPELIEHEPANPANGAKIEGLAAWETFTASGPAIASGTHIAVVEIDSETGEIEILRYIAVDDGGHILNHYLVEAQMHGALAQGIGQALFEEVIYDENGQNLTSTLMDYALPSPSQIPSFELDMVETPSPNNPLGAKGVGEAGTIGAPPTIVNAALDALAPFGITTIDMPLRPEKIWSLLHPTRS